MLYIKLFILNYINVLTIKFLELFYFIYFYFYLEIADIPVYRYFSRYSSIFP